MARVLPLDGIAPQRAPADKALTVTPGRVPLDLHAVAVRLLTAHRAVAAGVVVFLPADEAAVLVETGAAVLA